MSLATRISFVSVVVLAAMRPGRLLLAVTVLGACLRLYGLGDEGMTNDEAFSWRVSKASFLGLVSRVADDTHPPGHFLLLKVWTEIAGDSLIMLRLLSVVCGVVLIPAVYCMVRDSLTEVRSKTQGPFDEVEKQSALEWHQRPRHSSQDTLSGYAHSAISHWTRANSSALLTAVLVALHAVQIEQARTARMYSLGALLATVSAWLLLRALREGRYNRWFTYGVAAAGLLYCHHYSLFTLGAQAIFLAGCIVAKARHDPCGALDTARGAAIGFGVALVLYSPWLPVFLAQADRVREGFWVPEMTWRETSRCFFEWATGREHLHLVEQIGWSLVVCTVIFRAAWRTDLPSLFFVVQAALPWLLTFGISLLGDRPIFQARYFAISQISIMGLWGVVCCRLPRWSERVLWSSVLLLYCGSGGLAALSGGTSTSTSIAQAVDWVVDRYRPGDMVLASSPQEVNQFRYYAERRRMATIDIRCHVDLSAPGQIAHVASLEVEDMVVSRRWQPPSTIERVWVTHLAPAPYPFWDLRTAMHFAGSKRDKLTLRLYVRTAPHSQDGGT